eukprot:1849656-Rhodomonas_salina.4
MHSLRRVDSDRGYAGTSRVQRYCERGRAVWARNGRGQRCTLRHRDRCRSRAPSLGVTAAIFGGSTAVYAGGAKVFRREIKHEDTQSWYKEHGDCSEKLLISTRT